MQPQFGLRSATRPHEAGIASNRRSAILAVIRSRVLYSLPVKSREPGVPEVPPLCSQANKVAQTNADCTQNYADSKKVFFFQRLSVFIQRYSAPFYKLVCKVEGLR